VCRGAGRCATCRADSDQPQRNVPQDKKGYQGTLLVMHLLLVVTKVAQHSSMLTQQHDKGPAAAGAAARQWHRCLLPNKQYSSPSTAYLRGRNDDPCSNCACVEGPSDPPHLLGATRCDELLGVLVAICLACLQPGSICSFILMHLSRLSMPWIMYQDLL
jgi:hypothetical protein